jgi:ATP-dependent RNA helicase DDX52/ROK1
VFRPLPGARVSKGNREDKPVVKKKRKSKAQVEEEIGVLRKKFHLHVAGDSIPPPMKDFDQLRSLYRCKKNLLRKVVEAGYGEPTPIQRQAIPALLHRRECLAFAPTGSGKTLAFMLPIVINLQVGAQY